MSGSLMIQGTMSSAGKSFLVTGLIRLLKQEGYRAAPFKSQNMALNAFVTPDGLELGKAQALQAEAGGIKPSWHMNPILLKPQNHVGSEVIVRGKRVGYMKAREYFEYKTQLWPVIYEAYAHLKAENDFVVIEGAGSPAEINLKAQDIVNMGLAKRLRVPVLLAGDIDRGGVFAQLYGTVKLLPEAEQRLIQGLIINKFRGDATLLTSGIKEIERLTGIEVFGTVPYMDVDIEEEDSLSETRLKSRFVTEKKKIAVLKRPYMLNVTDFAPLSQLSDVETVYATGPESLDEADLVIVPAVKSPKDDGALLKASPCLDVLKKKEKKVLLIGNAVESLKSAGLVFEKLEAPLGRTPHMEGLLESFSFREVSGYGSGAFFVDRDAHMMALPYHSIFDGEDMQRALLHALALPEASVESYRAYKEKQYDALADTLRRHIDVGRLFELLRSDV